MRHANLLLGAAALLVAQSGVAQTKTGSSAAAEALFKQGRDLMSAGKHDEACRKFEASQQLEPGLGTLLNLAECYEKTGRTASAWAEYRKAIPLARAAGSKARQDLATDRAERLEQRLSTLTIRVAGGGGARAPLEVRRDGVPVQPAELGSAIPVDPGEHVIDASSPGHEPWSTRVVVGPDAAKAAVEIPQLRAIDAGVTSETQPPVVASAAITSPPSDRPPGSGSTQRVAGLVVSGAGVVGLGVGAFFGLRAFDKWSEAKEACSDYPYGCGTTGADLRASASSAGTTSTIAFIAGGALVATGVILYLTAPTKPTSVAVTLGPQSVAFGGHF